MKSKLQYFEYDTNRLSDCGQVLDIEFSSDELLWPGIILEKGSSPHFYPENVYTPYFYFALALDQELHWSASTSDGMTPLKTTPGDFWINPPRTPFSHSISDPCHFVILAIEEHTFLESCSLTQGGSRAVKPGSSALQFLNNYNVHDETLKGIVELFLVEARSGGNNGSAYLENLLALLSTHYIRNYSNFSDLQNQQADSSKFDHAHLAKLDRYIADNTGVNLSVDDLADLLHCSKFHFLREFKKLVGMTPYQYLLEKRLEKAKTLLSGTHGTIAAIALELGFTDQSHFTRSFRKQFGVTPGQFQKQSR